MAKETSATGIIAVGAASDATAPPRLASDSLFAVSTQPVLIVDSVSEKIVEANPAAARLLGVDRGALVGTSLPACFDRASLRALTDALNAARAPSGAADTVRVRANFSARVLQLRLSSFLANQRTYILAHLASGFSGVGADCGESASSEVLRAIDAAPVGFIVTDSAFFVEYANRAFSEMVGQEGGAEFRGKPAARWLKFSAADLERLRAQRSRRQAATLFFVGLRSVAKPLRRVEVCAVVVPDGRETCWGFTIRELARLN